MFTPRGIKVHKSYKVSLAKVTRIAEAARTINTRTARPVP
jgi:hypothetical protein